MEDTLTKCADTTLFREEDTQEGRVAHTETGQAGTLG